MPTVTHGISLVALLTIIKTNQPSSHCSYYTHTYKWTRTHLNEWTHMRACTHTHTNVRMPMKACMCMHTRARTYAHAHTHTLSNTSTHHIQLYYDSCLEHLVSCSCWIYVGYPESKFRWAINKKTRIYYKPCILPFDVHTVHYFST